ncbi:MAG: hypothetical protein IJV20_12235 [Prevotella sp.]|nr:hypothetical protein [Prevotella sp.]
MARPVGRDSGNIVSIHPMGKYRYASTQRIDLKRSTSKKKAYKHYHWGTVDEELRFIPGKNYIYASPEERAKLIFPNDWDMSMAKQLERQASSPMSASVVETAPDEIAENRNRFYGATWLLEELARSTGLREDLMETFHNNQIMVDDVLTIAMYLFLTNYNLSRLSSWQNLEKYPSQHELTSPMITMLEQSITDQHRMDFLRCRAARLDGEEIVSVDSTTKSSFEGKLIDIAWGKNKEGLKLPVTMEVVAYSVTSHMPVYYRTFPGNFPDARSVELICTDMREAGFSNFIMVTDRAYGSAKNLEMFIRMSQKSIMCQKVSTGISLEQIRGLGDYEHVPKGFKYSRELDLYCRQFDISYTIKLEDGKRMNADMLRLNLYFDPVHKSRILKALDIELLDSEETFREMITEKAVIGFEEDREAFEREHDIYDLEWGIRKIPADPERHKDDLPRPGRKRKYDDVFVLKSYKRNYKRFKDKKLTAGFRGLLTLGVDMDPEEAMYHYGLRSEQEMDFEQWKSLMQCDRERNSSEAGKAGATFIQFVAKIMSSQLRYRWRSSEKLREEFASSLAIIDEMRNIRCVEYPEQQKMIMSPFVGKQLTVCEEMGIQIPEGCDKQYKSRRVRRKQKNS